MRSPYSLVTLPLLISCASLLGCGGGGGDAGPEPTVFVDAMSPLVGEPGDVIVIKGRGFNEFLGSPSVTIGDRTAFLRSATIDTIAFEIPSGATTGQVRVSNFEVSAFSPKPLTIARREPTDETEPNDSGDDFNLVGPANMVRGALPDNLDVDRFVFDEVVAGIEYQFRVSPVGPVQVFVNGEEAGMDTNGEFVFTSTQNRALVEIRGAPLSYTIEALLDY